MQGSGVHAHLRSRHGFQEPSYAALSHARIDQASCLKRIECRHACVCKCVFEVGAGTMFEVGAGTIALASIE